MKNDGRGVNVRGPLDTLPRNVTGTTHEGSSTVAVARARREGPGSSYAEVIDLVHLPRGTRPTPIAFLEYEEVNRCRVMDCMFYQQCLNFAARVQWRSFHCRQCPHHPDRVAGARIPCSDDPRPASVIRLPAL